MHPRRVEVQRVEELAQFRLVGRDYEQVLVLADGLLLPQRHQRVAELRHHPITPLTSSKEIDPSSFLSKYSKMSPSRIRSFYGLPPRAFPTLFKWYATAVSAAFFSRL